MTASVRAQIAEGRLELIAAGLSAADAALDAEVLARHILGWDRAHLLVRRDQPSPAGFSPSYRTALDRRAAREPVALITGHREFWGLDFEVTGDVLVPRPETELVVQEALAWARHRPPLRRIVDVGTGSGCLAVALGLEYPSAQVIAVDLSAAALSIAARNVARQGLMDRLQLVQANLLDAIAGPVDLIVSNPPYVACRDRATLQPEILRYEPAAALFAAEEGLAIIRELCETAARRLVPGGALILEFGAGQEPALHAIARTNRWAAQTIPDLAGIPRVAVLSRVE